MSGKKKTEFKIRKLSIGKKTILGVLILTVVLSAVSLLIGSMLQKNVRSRNYEEDTWQMARTIAILLDGANAPECFEEFEKIHEQIPDSFYDEMNSCWQVLEDAGEDSDMEEVERASERYTVLQEEYQACFEPLKTEQYRQIRSSLASVARENDINAIEIFIIDPVRNKPVIVFAGYGDEETDLLYALEQTGMEADYLDGFEDFMKNGSQGRFSTNYGAPMTKGTVFASIAPYYHPDTGEIIAYVMAMDMWDAIVADQEKYFRSYLLGVVLAALALSILAHLVTRRLIVRPLEKMGQAAKNYTDSEEKIGKAFFRDLDIDTGDEIEVLGRTLQDLEIELGDYFTELTRVTKEKERISAELSVAARIQEDMLPSEFPAFPDRHEFDLYAMMRPARGVGGDFYDFYFIDPDHLVLTIADVSGKGIPAALFMVISKTILKNCALNGGSPAEILETANHQLCEGNDSNMFVTVWLGILTLSTGKLICANGGHEHPLIRRRGQPFELIQTKHKPVLGAIDGMKYADEQYELNPGDVLFVYTDGVPEATASDDTMFTTDRLTETLNTAEETDDPEKILDTVLAGVRDFVGEAPQFDDLTMLTVVYRGNSGPEE